MLRLPIRLTDQHRIDVKLIANGNQQEQFHNIIILRLTDFLPTSHGQYFVVLWLFIRPIDQYQIDIELIVNGNQQEQFHNIIILRLTDFYPPVTVSISWCYGYL